MKNSTFLLIASVLVSLYTLFLADGLYGIGMGFVAFICAIASLICSTIEGLTK